MSQHFSLWRWSVGKFRRTLHYEIYRNNKILQKKKSPTKKKGKKSFFVAVKGDIYQSQSLNLQNKLVMSQNYSTDCMGVVGDVSKSIIPIGLCQSPHRSKLRLGQLTLIPFFVPSDSSGSHVVSLRCLALFIHTGSSHERTISGSAAVFHICM